MMYRQIRIVERDVELQRIVWSPDENTEPLHFQLLTVTYGESCAPYLSLLVLEHRYPDAVQAVLKDRYIDDLLTGADDPESAQKLRNEIISLLKAGGFPLSKWVANTPELLEDLANEDCLRPTWRHLPMNELGISWNPVDDTFRLTPPQIKSFRWTL
ncbi:hypothetical protein TSAR_004745 [Trichomalopsis sarcophagae]|uniref:Reverse transcriptase domain-containing protein n=1 Tax=Trichomalopsis sarcophagae TaxID=543379 RepID=A0A232FJY6_9HYME|nr:hypothetical protein TSAR_004745 [Trichomalopsis sarcophagae]